MSSFKERLKRFIGRGGRNAAKLNAQDGSAKYGAVSSSANPFQANVTTALPQHVPPSIRTATPIQSETASCNSTADTSVPVAWETSWRSAGSRAADATEDSATEGSLWDRAFTSISSLYQSLDASRQEIRLLEIIPSPNFPSTVQCRLFTASLAETPLPTYKALSYVWGDAGMTSEIFINGVSRQATVNLVSALRHIRSKTNTVVLWADALCINQNDVRERSKQVAIMGSIYRSAELVLAWLGDEADGSDLAFDMIELWAQWAERWPLGILEVPSFGHDMAPGLAPTTILALAALAGRSYWKRVWVLQELALSAAVYVLCGQKALPIERVILAMYGWHRLSLALVDRENGVPLHAYEVMALLPTAMTEMIAPYVQHHPPPISDLHRLNLFSTFYYDGDHLSTEFLFQLRRLKSSDPRDKVYGLLGVLRTNSTSLIPDYTKSVHDFFPEIARLLILQEGGLKAVICATQSSNILGAKSLPSWTPNWEIRAENHPGHFLEDCVPWYRKGPLGFDISKAVRFSTDNRILYVGGRAFGKVIHLPRNLFPFFGDNIGAIAQLIQDPVSGSELPPLQALFRIVSLDSDHFILKTQRLTSDELVYNYTAALFLKHLAGKLSENLPQSTGPELMETLIKAFVGNSRESEARSSLLLGLVELDNPTVRQHLWKFGLYLGLHCQHRTLFRTEDGTMGIGPDDMVEDDILCQLVGHGFPMVLRKASHRYLVVGECYIPDLDLPRVTENDLSLLQEFEIH